MISATPPGWIVPINLADLDKDGAYELVVGTGTYLAGKGYFVSAFDYDLSAMSYELYLGFPVRKKKEARDLQPTRKPLLKGVVFQLIRLSKRKILFILEKFPSAKTCKSYQT